MLSLPWLRRRLATSRLANATELPLLSVAASASEVPNVAPVVVLMKVTVPVGLTPLELSSMMVLNVTLSPGVMAVRLAVVVAFVAAGVITRLGVVEVLVAALDFAA